MADREKVIKGLQESAAYFRSSFDVMSGTFACEMFRSWTDAIEQALALLQKQGPRAVTLEEIKEGESYYWLTAGEDFIPRPVICVHREDDARKPYIIFAWQFGTFSWATEDYGKIWRCWTARPTDEQRKAAPWQD